VMDHFISIRGVHIVWYITNMYCSLYYNAHSYKYCFCCRS